MELIKIKCILKYIIYKDILFSQTRLFAQKIHLRGHQLYVRYLVATGSMFVIFDNSSQIAIFDINHESEKQTADEFRSQFGSGSCFLQM